MEDGDEAAANAEKTVEDGDEAAANAEMTVEDGDEAAANAEDGDEADVSIALTTSPLRVSRRIAARRLVATEDEEKEKDASENGEEEDSAAQDDEEESEPEAEDEEESDEEGSEREVAEVEHDEQEGTDVSFQELLCGAQSIQPISFTDYDIEDPNRIINDDEVFLESDCEDGVFNEEDMYSESASEIDTDEEQDNDMVEKECRRVRAEELRVEGM